MGDVGVMYVCVSENACVHACLCVCVCSFSDQCYNPVKDKLSLTLMVTQQVAAERDKLRVKQKPPLLVKIAPDLSDKDKADIAAVIMREKVCMCLFLCLSSSVSVSLPLCPPPRPLFFYASAIHA